MRKITLLAAVAFPTLLVLYCGDNGTGADDLGGTPPSTDDAKAFLNSTIPALFDSLDADRFEESLHPDFRFLFLGGQAPDEHPGGFWGKRTESAVIDSVFRSPEVTAAALQISVLDDTLELVAGTESLWSYRATTLTELGIHTTGSDTTGAFSYYAFTKIEYELRRDTRESTGWLLYEETELPFEFDSHFKVRSVDGSWGQIKANFYAPLDPPAERTIKGTVRLDGGDAPAPGVTVTAGEKSAVTDAHGRFTIKEVDPALTTVVFDGPNTLTETAPVGGGDDVYRLEITLQSYPFQETPADFLDQFVEAYGQGDSVRYGGMLDSRYRFELLDIDIDPVDLDSTWDRATELEIAGRMFNARYNQEGQRVERIVLDLTEISTVIDRTDYPPEEKPPGEIWYKVTAFVDLLVTVIDPDDPEGAIHFVVLSDQIFILRPDPQNEGRYLLVRQIDQEPIHKRDALPAGTEASSWGAVKSLWR